MSYIKYQGKFEKSSLVHGLKKFHNRIKGYFIRKFSQNTVIDIGSGRGSDAFYYVKNKINCVIGIEPSKDSIDRAIRQQKKYSNTSTEFIYLNGTGEKNWDNGEAALSFEYKEKFIHIFNEKNIQANTINMFWTIHYMMNTYNDFYTLLKNIKSHLKKNGYLVILCMNGEKIHQLLQKYKGYYSIKHDNQEIFAIRAEYPFNKKIGIFGNPITVYLKGTYGLEKGIIENLVFIEELTKILKEEGFQKILQKNHLELNFIKEFKLLSESEKKISELYEALVFKYK